MLPSPTEIILPSQPTLDKYGLSVDEWLAFVPVKDGVRVCPICEKPPKTGRFVVDHQHTPGWKTKAPDERKKYVRGVVCTTCNHFVLTRYGSPLRHRNAAAYLEAYAGRRENG
jgi:hypothetical protein